MADPFETFEAIIERSERMIGIYRNIIKIAAIVKVPAEKADEKELQDILRSALVISVSAFDSYFTDKFVDKAPTYLNHNTPSDNLIELLTKAGVDLRAALILIQTDRPLRRIRTFIERYLERYVTQEFSKIDELYLSLDIKDLTKHAAQKTKVRTIRKRIQNGIQRRHSIVHAGDLNAHAKARNITANYVDARISEMKRFVKACDEIIESATKPKAVKRRAAKPVAAKPAAAKAE